MPYVMQDYRDDVDPLIDELIEKMNRYADGWPATAGTLNYCITRLMGLFPINCYGNIAVATGVLENVKQELYRRAVAPYEDEKAAQNGDVY